MKRFTFLLLLLLTQSAVLFAHTVDYFNSCGYICTGSTLTVSAHVSNTNSSSRYNWQYRDNSNVWKCFASGNNTINGVVFSVSGVSATGTLSTSPVLTIANAKSDLEDVEVRLLIADGNTPCASNPSYPIYGADKALRLHVLSGSDCNSISTYCSMGGCVGNTLSCSDGYYGGFEIGSGSIGIASTDYSLVTSNSSCGNYAIVNNAQQIYSSFGSFAPHSGNYMLYADGSGTAGKRVWYKTVSVVKGSMYQFSAWIANAGNTNNQKAIVRLKIDGANDAEATKTVTATAGDWQYLKVDYTASQTGSVTLSISDDNCSCPDNDFVIDDICFVCHGPAPALSLGNQVWNDFDGDGKRDDNEPGIAGATISLYTDNNGDNLPDGAAVKTTVSDALGHYLFTDLAPGRYIASLPVLPGYQRSPNTSTQTTTSPNPDNDVDNDDNLVRLVGANGPGGVLYTNAITLSANGEPTTDGDDANSNLTFDLAECGNSAIGDFVWNDLNGNGVQDAGEPGINGVLVTITFSDGRTATTTTATYNAANNANAPQYDGYYNFINLGPDVYKISFATPAGLRASPSKVGSNDAKDSDPVNGGAVTVTLAANQSNFTIDAGFTNYTPPVANLKLGNQVWNDFDGDGKRDDNEPGIAGATISLYTDNNGDNLPDGAAIKTTVSDALGHYLFTDLASGRYIASLPVLPGYQQSPNTSTQATSPNPDNDVDNDDNLVRLVGANGPGGVLYTNAITLSANGEPTADGDDANSNLTFDLAECGNSAIGDFVWNDLNGNGIQDAGEPGINGVLVTITFSDGRTATTTTATYNAANNANAPQYDGYYNFLNLGPDTYKISFATPAGLRASPSNAGGNDAKDSDPVNGGPVTVTLAANQSNFTIDAGFTNYTPKLTLGNQIFLDANGNGVKDVNEPGIAGLTVKLYADNNGDNTADGAALATKTTATDGTYLFDNLAAGKYLIGVTTGTAYVVNTIADLTPDDNKDNDNNGYVAYNGDVFTKSITLSAGNEPNGTDNNSNLTLDIGLKTAPCPNHCDCHNDCTHTGCGHSNCGHNSCHNDCTHTGCGHANCGHNSCKNDCSHTGCGHSNCGHNSCKNNCTHIGCGHPNCGHNSCKNDCSHTGCGHANCGHNSCKNDCTHTSCGHANCGHNSCKNDCTHTGCGHPNCGHNSCKNDCNHTGCGHANCGHNSCKNDCTHTGCGHANCGKDNITITTVSVFPNPCRDYCTLKIDAVKSGEAQIRITDLFGRLMISKTVTLTAGTNSMTFNDLGSYSAGLYYIQILFNYHVYNQQVLLTK